MTFGDFFDHLGDIDWLGVIAGTIAVMGFGMIWYGPLFGKAWAKATGQPMSSKPEPAKIVLTAAYLLVFNVGIAYLFPLDDVEHALVWGLVVGVLIIGSALYAGVVWRSDKPTAHYIDMGHWLLAATLSIYIQGLFV